MRLFAQSGGQPRRENVLAAIQKSKNAANTQRMAGDKLENAADDIIAELRGERDDGIIQNAMDDLFSLREINKDIDSQFVSAANAAGLGIQDLQKATNILNGDFQTVGNISEKTPEALVIKYPSTKVYRDNYDRRGTPVVNETRIHTKSVINPVTGQRDVVPFVAQGEEQPLVTHFGLVGKDIDPRAVEGMDSDEFLGKRILQLAGMQPVRNNDANVYAVDLLDQKSGNKVDVEMVKKEDLRDRGTVGFQVYTEASPASLAGSYPRDLENSRQVARQMAEDLKPLIDEKLRQGLTLKEAMQDLTAEGKITNSDGRFGPNEGKLLKEEGTYVDQLVHPVVKRADASANLRTKKSKQDKRKLVMPLEGALLSDANAGKAYLKEVRGLQAKKKLSLRPMPGNNNDRPSAKVYLDVPVDDRQFVADLAQLTPAVRQLFGKQ